MRMFTASLGTESNTFSPISTSLTDYKDSVYYPAGQHPDDGPRQCTAQLVVARKLAATTPFTLIEGSCYFSNPGGTTNREDYENMRDTILTELQAAMPVDTVVLGLHGAMVAHGYDDVEGDLLDAVRDIVGPDCIIGAELDPHCHVTLRRLRQADVLVMYKEYPHTDTVEAAEQLLDIVLRTYRGEVEPVMSVFDCKQLGSFPTTHPDMRAFVDHLKTLEGRDDILSISLGHSYPYGDVPELGAKVLVVSNGNKAAADAMATRVGETFMGFRGKTTPKFHGIDEGIDLALALYARNLADPDAVAKRGMPVVMTDAADNAGGGAPSDNTSILHRLIARGIGDVAVAPLWDPIAVRNCFSAGLGARMPLRFGGKSGTMSGTPVDAVVEVRALVRDAWQSYGPARTSIGDAATVRIFTQGAPVTGASGDGAGAIDVVINTGRTQALGPELFSAMNVDISTKKALVLKSSNHFMAGFGKLIGGVVHIHTDGLLVRDDYRKIPYARVQRPIWPLDEALTGELIF